MDGQKMSGIYIPGMEMPKGCAYCKISRRNGKKMICPFIWKCEWDIRDPMSADHRLDGCPLVPVPPHGRLIDADALLKQLEEGANQSIGQAHYTYSFASAYVRNAPTIIPAEEEGEE